MDSNPVSRTLIVIALLSLVLAACGGSKDVKKEEAYDPENYLAKADKLIDDKDYDEARRILLEVKNRDTIKKYAPLAQLKYAESYLKEGDPDLAVAEYRKFLDLYPDNKNASYAQYQIAMAYFSQIESPDRGSGAAQRALQEFLRLKELFPRNPYREIVELRIEKCRNVIADGEFLVGEFYFKKGSYVAAIARFEGLLKRFPDYKRADETLFLIGKSYRALKEQEKAGEAFSALMEKYPLSKFAIQAGKERR